MLYHQPGIVPAVADRGSPSRPLTVGILLLPRFSMLSLAAFLDVLRHAGDDEGLDRQNRCAWTIMGVTTEAVQASCGIEITPWERLGDPGRFDYVVVVGGKISANVGVSSELLDYLRTCAGKGVRLAGIGGGVAALVEAGLLNSRRCCVHWHSFFDFVSSYGDVVPVGDQLFLVDGNQISCAGEFASGDLANWMIERHMGPAVSQRCRDLTLLREGRNGNVAQPHPGLIGNISNERVRRAVILMEQRLCEPVRVAEIASRIHLSKRQLERLFQKELGTSIQSFSRWIRLRYGLFKLQQSTDTVTQIAHDCGFADSSHFCRTFARTFGHSPTSVRLNPALAAALYARFLANPGADQISCDPVSAAAGEPMPEASEPTTIAA